MRIRNPNTDKPAEGFRTGSYSNRGQMSELERLFHLFVSLQILFGSRRGGIGVPLILLALLIGGWFVYSNWFRADPALSRADRKWESGESTQRIEAIKDYKELLRKKDPLDANFFWMRERSGRARLYRRIVEYHVMYDIDKSAARDWVYEAWSENIRDLDFENDEVNEYYKKVTDEIKAKQKSLGPLGGVLSQ
jgi:hypothetical protein